MINAPACCRFHTVLRRSPKLVAITADGRRAISGYDSLGRLVEETANGASVHFVYDDAADNIDLIYPDGRHKKENSPSCCRPSTLPRFIRQVHQLLSFVHIVHERATAFYIQHLSDIGQIRVLHESLRSAIYLPHSR